MLARRGRSVGLGSLRCHPIVDGEDRMGSRQAGPAHLGDVREDLVQLLVGLEDAVTGEIVGRPDRLDALPPRGKPLPAAMSSLDSRASAYT